MSGASPLDVIVRVAEMLDELRIDYVLGGSLAGSFFGEPRATADVDIAIHVEVATGERLLGRAAAEFHVPTGSARAAIQNHDSFNLVAGDQSSDQQSRDIIGIVRVSGDTLDLPDLRSTADELGLDELLDRALGDV